MPDFIGLSGLPEVMEADQDAPGEVPPKLSVLRVQPLIGHGLEGHVLRPDGAFFPHEVAAAPGYLIPPEIGAPDGHPPLGGYVGGLNVIEPQNRIQSRQVAL